MKDKVTKTMIGLERENKMNAAPERRWQRVGSTCRVVVLGVCCPFLLTALATGNGPGRRGADFDVSWYTMDGGGGTSSGGDFELNGTIGQHDASTAMTGGFWPGVSVSEPEPEPCEGDANGDGAVDPLDSGYVLARFGCPVGSGDPSCDAADVNGDGAVDPLDSGFVLARFGPCE